MKKNYLLLLLFSVTSLLAQCPTNLTTYYSSATGTGAALKTQLFNIIKGHNDRGYAGLWTTYQTSDRDVFTGAGYENDNTIYDLYSENPNAADPYNFTYSTNQCGSYSVEGDCYNREHMIPQSSFGSAAPMVSDAHFIPPTDGKVNGYRSDFPHGEVASVSRTMANGATMGTSAVSGYTGTVYEPLDAFKGDIARMYFYYVTRYEDKMGTTIYEPFNNTTHPSIYPNFLAMLIQWHNNDPVSAFEIARNNAICARQNNRNPYIDHPEWVAAVWGGSTVTDTQAPTIATNLAVTGTTAYTASLSWTAATDNTAVTSYDVYVDGVLTASTSGTTITITSLSPTTTYAFYVVARDAAGNSSPISSSVNGTTLAGGSGVATELFFSEYVEGLSTNKAIEIANFTGAPVDLSLYSIKKQTNGAGAWSTGLALTGTLANGAVYLITTNTTASPCVPSRTADLATAATELAFNGNDPVGLFKNGSTLIDMLGVLNVTANFSIDETLRRKSSIISPNINFNKASEWDSFAANTCGDLGNHTFLPLSTEDFTENNFNIYPNPSNGKFYIDFEALGDYAVEIFSTIGQKITELKINNKKNIEISNLQQGIYLVKITKDSKSIVKKIVIN